MSNLQTTIGYFNLAVVDYYRAEVVEAEDGYILHSGGVFYIIAVKKLRIFERLKSEWGSVRINTYEVYSPNRS